MKAVALDGSDLDLAGSWGQPPYTDPRVAQSLCREREAERLQGGLRPAVSEEQTRCGDRVDAVRLQVAELEPEDGRHLLLPEDVEALGEPSCLRLQRQPAG